MAEPGRERPFPRGDLAGAEIGEPHIAERLQRADEPPAERPDGGGGVVGLVPGKVPLGELGERQRLGDGVAPRTGEIPSFRLASNVLRFSADEVAAWLETRRRSGTSTSVVDLQRGRAFGLELDASPYAARRRARSAAARPGWDPVVPAAVEPGWERRSPVQVASSLPPCVGCVNVTVETPEASAGRKSG